MKCSPRQSRPLGMVAGFTLLEILLVLCLMGLAGSVVVGRIIPDDSRANTERLARQIIVLANSAHDEAMISGRHYGLKLDRSGYYFLRFEKGVWQDVMGDKWLTKRTLPSAYTLSFTPGESVWQESLTLEDGLTVFDSRKDESRPDIYLWSSGDITPGTMMFQTPSHSLEVILEEIGTISLAGEKQS